MEVEVMTRHYMGRLLIEQAEKKQNLFYVSADNGFVGRVRLLRKQDHLKWFSPDITDKELLEQIGEWIEYTYEFKA
jgi:hypothetical protein